MESSKRHKKGTPEKNLSKHLQKDKVNETKPENVSKAEGKWMTAEKKKKKRLRRPKPDKMIISAKGEVTYADILKKIRTDPELAELGNEVNKVRRTQKGDLVLELKTASLENASKFNKKIETCLEGRVAVRTHKEETIVECKDLDDITTKQEISLAFGKAFNIPDLDESSVKSLRKSYGGTQSAKISLPVESARKALEVGKIKIGWSLCRIRESIKLTMCYRCLEYGHMAKFCTTEEDRSHQCRKCGGEGHISKDCKAEPNCLLCKSTGGTDLKHIAGSYRCPVFKKALSAKYK